VTVTIARHVVPGRTEEFERWADELTRTASRFPGYLGAGLLRPGAGGGTWHVVCRFENSGALGDWERSAERAQLLADGAGLVEKTDIQRVSGLETWFALPGRIKAAPARWKMYCVSCLAIYLLQFGAYEVLGRLVFSWPLGLRLRPVVMVVTAAMTWVVMPFVAALLAHWLYPSTAAGSARRKRRFRVLTRSP
jgi:uncharacterized protein